MIKRSRGWNRAWVTSYSRAESLYPILVRGIVHRPTNLGIIPTKVKGLYHVLGVKDDTKRTLVDFIKDDGYNRKVRMVKTPIEVVTYSEKLVKSPYESFSLTFKEAWTHIIETYKSQMRQTNRELINEIMFNESD